MVTAEFSDAVRDMLAERSGSRCEVCGEAKATDAHHRRGRGAGSTRRPESSSITNALHVCGFGGCHHLIEQHRGVALLLGWAVSQFAEPADTPLVYRGAWAFLTEDGQVTYQLEGSA